MPKKSRVRTLMDSQHVKRSETRLKYSRQYFLSTFSITLKWNQLQELFFSGINNLDTVC